MQLRFSFSPNRVPLTPASLTLMFENGGKGGSGVVDICVVSGSSEGSHFVSASTALDGPNSSSP